jgi:hypothetical protein
VFRSDDGGDTWVDPGGSLAWPFPQLFPGGEEPREMFAVTAGLSATLDLAGPVRELMFDRRQPDLLYTVVAGLVKKVVE